MVFIPDSEKTAYSLRRAGLRSFTNFALARLRSAHVGAPIPPASDSGAILVAGVANRGYTLGQNLACEARGAAGKEGQMANLMQELRAANVDAVEPTR
jgi:hypothetical protein